VGLIWNPERLFVYSHYKEIKVMPPEDYYITTFTISMDEFSQIFPWFENLTDGMPVEKPKAKRGRKPKAHHTTDKAVEMKAS
jgi:hypothetical protein